MSLARSDRDGHSLLELMVAMSLTGLFGVTAMGLIALTDEVIEQATARRAHLDHATGSGRWIADAVRSISAYDPVASAGFHGQSSGFRTRAWVVSPYGGSEIATLEVHAAESHVIVHAGSQVIVLMDSLVAARFAYAGLPDGPTVWLDNWESPDAPPWMIRLLTEDPAGHADTTLWYVGARQ